MTITDEDIGNALTGMLRRFDAEYQTMTEADLGQRWHFEWEPDRSLAWNIYRFHGCLELYAKSCRKWEELHNGHMCVVERVRDKYLMPKIGEFERALSARCIEEAGRRRAEAEIAAGVRLPDAPLDAFRAELQATCTAEMIEQRDASGEVVGAHCPRCGWQTTYGPARSWRHRRRDLQKSKPKI